MAKLIKKSIEASSFGLISFDKKKSAPKKAPQKRVMPTADDDAVRMARKRAIARQQARSGRAATILSGGGSNSYGSGFGG